MTSDDTQTECSFPDCGCNDVRNCFGQDGGNGLAQAVINEEPKEDKFISYSPFISIAEAY